MSMMAYRATMFMVFFNYAMMIANLIGRYIFPNTQVKVSCTAGLCNNTSFYGAGIFTSLSGMLNVSDISTLLLTAGVLALFAFSLLVPTIPFVFAFFALSGIITSFYVFDLPLPWEFKIPLITGVAIVYYIGISQYAARSSFSGS
jgi:hypothetical protein